MYLKQKNNKFFGALKIIINMKYTEQKEVEDLLDNLEKRLEEKDHERASLGFVKLEGFLFGYGEKVVKEEGMVPKNEEPINILIKKLTTKRKDSMIEDLEVLRILHNLYSNYPDFTKSSGDEEYEKTIDRVKKSREKIKEILQNKK